MSYQHSELITKCGLARFSPAARSVLHVFAHKAQLDDVKYNNAKVHHKGYRPEKGDGWLFLTDDDLGFMTGYGSRQIDNAIKELVEYGAVTRPYIAKKGASKANEYQLQRSVLLAMAEEASSPDWKCESKTVKAAREREAGKPEGAKHAEAKKGLATRRRKAEDQFGVTSAVANDVQSANESGTGGVQSKEGGLSVVSVKDEIATKCVESAHGVQSIQAGGAGIEAPTALKDGTGCAPVIRSNPQIILDNPDIPPPKAGSNVGSVPPELKESKAGPHELASQSASDPASDPPQIDPTDLIWAVSQIHAAFVDRGNVSTPTKLRIPVVVQRGEVARFSPSWRVCWEFIQDYPEDFRQMIEADAAYIRCNRYFIRGYGEIEDRHLNRHSVPTVRWYFDFNARGERGRDLIEQRKFFKFEEEKVEFRLPEGLTKEQEELHRQFHQEATEIFQSSKRKPTISYEK